ncbi:MAG: hypothetical protein ACTHM1_12595 [Solirubrobacteraceae bacterium]
MASATSTRPDSGAIQRARPRAVWTASLERLGLAGVGALALACFFAFRTYPTYDSLYALLWGRELLHGQLPDLHVYRAPTEHPLALAFGAVCSLFGQAGARLVVLGSVASFVALLAGIHRIARLCFGPLVASIAALLVLSRFFVENLALQGYLDVTYAALVVWAAALEVQRPRRGWPVLALLCAAGLLRPEAWLLGGVYWLWCAASARSEAKTRMGQLALAALAPALWLALDAALTGDPLFSLRSASGLAQQLGRSQGIVGVVSSTWTYAVRIDKLPVVLGAIVGAVAALRLAPRRSAAVLALLACLLIAFVAEGSAGTSVLDRYMVAPAMVMVLLCAVALGGWSLLDRASGARRGWMAAAAALVLFGVVDVSSTLTVRGLRETLAYHEELDRGLAAALRDRAVSSAIARCGLISLPNNKLTPDVRWILHDPRAIQVVARSDARERAHAGHDSLLRRLRVGSVAVYPHAVTHFFDAVAGVGEGPFATQPQAGLRAIYTSRTYAAYANC